MSNETGTGDNLFERAARIKLRFESPRGHLNVEDLWDLPLTSDRVDRPNLDAIAMDLHRQTKESAEVVSFVLPVAEDRSNDTLALAFEIVKRVIAVKVAERDQAKEAADRKERKQQLLRLIAEKQDQELAGRSVEELRAMVEAL